LLVATANAITLLLAPARSSNSPEPNTSTAASLAPPPPPSVAAAAAAWTGVERLQGVVTVPVAAHNLTACSRTLQLSRLRSVGDALIRTR